MNMEKCLASICMTCPSGFPCCAAASPPATGSAPPVGLGTAGSNMAATAAAVSREPPPHTRRPGLGVGLGRPPRSTPRGLREPPASPWELVRPSVTELSRAVRSNILCTVPGCGKVLPNPPALSMHLSKAHGVQQDGKINPAIRKDLKTPQKYYCCPIEGCPRGPERPFSQFSLVRQHFMKMHAEKKHKCDKCNNSYGTIWDLKRHSEDCGKTFQCTCGCPYASRTALLSHIYRTQHVIPVEHRDPPSKKRKTETLVSSQLVGEKVKEASVRVHTRCTSTKDLETSEIKPAASSQDSSRSYTTKQTQTQQKNTPKLLLPKPKVALVKLPLMQLTHLPIFVSAPDSSVKPVVVAVDDKGSVMSTVHLMPVPVGIMISSLGAETLAFKSTLPLSKTKNAASVEPVSTGMQVSLDKGASDDTIQDLEAICYKNGICSTNVQTDLSYISQNFVTSAAWTPDSSVSSCSQTDLTFSSQVLLPISVQTQTLLPSSKLTSSIAAQTDAHAQACFQSCGISRETQTNRSQKDIDRRVQMDQAVMCNDIFDSVGSSFSDSTPVALPGTSLMNAGLGQNLLQRESCKSLSPDAKCEPIISFSTQNNILPQQVMTDNQTQTMELLNDLETIFSNNTAGQSLDNRSLLTDTSSSVGTPLPSGPTQNAGIDFDIEDFFTASNIQTQTEETELGNLNSEPVLESLDIETQTDLFSDNATQSYSCRGNPNFLGLEMFDTQTQTDLNFFLDSPYLPLGNILKQSTFSMSTDSSDTETQTEVHFPEKNVSNQMAESKVQLNSAETQTMDSCFETLGSLFLTSNETQTAMDDFLLADVAWNTMESQFSSVETQTCAELCSLFQGSDKASH
ncbi:ATM interactor isoform X2 [Rhineura floridana]|uniref:ATM interactor isoform X2 n=1 Tax=Rhineura floridana TaxID=261503 RepID=UPI002AC848EB|nr:ATM interactor isoform X2 [Rhineura floridana]